MALITLHRILIGVLLLSQSETPYELYSIGCQLDFNNKIEEAIEYYQRVMQINPESPEIYISLANAFYKMRQFDEGIDIASKGLSRWPEMIEMYHTLAIGYIGKGDFMAAIQGYEKYLQTGPVDIDVCTSLSLLYEGIGDIQEASDVLTDMPDSLKTSDIFLRLATLAGKMNDHKSALEYYQQSYALDTLNTTALVGIGTVYDLLSVKDSALFYYEKALREDTLILTVGRRIIELCTDTEQYEKIIEVAVDILDKVHNDSYIRKSLGYALYKIGMLRDALDEFMIVSKIDPKDTYSMFYIGRIYLEQGDYEAALKEIRQAIQIDPYFVELWVYLGFIAIEKRDFTTAEYAFTEAAHYGADMVQIYYLLGVVAEMEEQYTRAYFYYRKSLSEDQKNLATLEALAHLCDRIERKDEAFMTFQKIITLDTTNAEAFNYVGYTYAERNDSLEYALQLINKALSLEENNGYYFDSRGWVLYQMEKYAEALTDVKRAAAIVEDAVILEHLGDIYMKLNDVDRAKDAYQKALKYNAENKTLMHKLQKVVE